MISLLLWVPLVRLVPVFWQTGVRGAVPLVRLQCSSSSVTVCDQSIVLELDICCLNCRTLDTLQGVPFFGGWSSSSSHPARLQLISFS
jgi:hypothetical protein